MIKILLKMEKLNLHQILKETSESVSNGHSIEKLEEWKTLLKKLDREEKKDLKYAINILETVINLKKKKGNNITKKIFVSFSIAILLIYFSVLVNAGINYKINGETYFTIDQNTTRINNYLEISQDVNVTGNITHHRPVEIRDEIVLTIFNGTIHNDAFHIFVSNDASREQENHKGLTNATNNSLIFYTTNLANIYKMGYMFFDDVSNRSDLVISQGGVNRSSIFDRSLQIGKSLANAPMDENYTLCQGYNYIDCNSPLTGADLGVEDGIEAKGSIYAQGNMTADKYFGDGSQLSNIANCSGDGSCELIVYDSEVNPAPYGISSKNLIGYWTGENNALDYSGQGYDGSLEGNATYSDGIFGQGFEFDGSGDAFNMGDINAMDWAVDDSFSVSAWINFPTGVSGTDAFVSKGGGSPNGWVLRIDSNEKVQIRTNNQAAQSGVLSIGTWHHIVGMYNGTTLILYVDGYLSDTTPATYNNNPNADVMIGKAMNQWFTGSVDEVMVFNRELSATEIKKLYSFINTINDVANNSINTTHIVDGTITDADISDSTNLTLGEKITFAFGEMIDNIADGWIRITGNFNVTENLNVNGNTTFNGRVGIGTTDPDYALHLYRTNEHSVLQVEANGSSHGEANLFFKTQSDPGWQIFMDGSNLDDLGEADRLGFFYYGGGGALRMVIDGSSGNVGIGTSNPGLPLEVRNDDDNLAIFFDSRSQAQGVGGGIAFGGKYTDAGAEAMAGRIGTKKTNGVSGDVGFDMVFETQDSAGLMTERIICTSEGKCGIGDLTPTKTLEVNGDTLIRGELETDNGIIINGDIDAKSDIMVDGYIGIGDSTPNFLIDAYDTRTSGIKRAARFWTDGNHVDARGLYVIAGLDNQATGTNYYFEAYDGDGGTNVGGLRNLNGNFQVYDSSDRRLKQNIRDTEINASHIINSIKVRDFAWKENLQMETTGFIAQEILEVYPDAVGEADPESGMYSVSKDALIPPLIKYVQELEQENDLIKTELCLMGRIKFC